jgi:glutamate racemase
VGGLTVANEILKTMPGEGIVYAGDTARVPYGGKSPEILLRYGREIIDFLIHKHNVKAIVVACGTISSNVFPDLCVDFPEIPLIDVIQPGVKATLALEPKKVGFIATEATVRSGLFTRLLKAKNTAVQVESRACPLFVPLVEEGWVNNVVTQLITETYLEDWMGTGLDTLVLGCTHYPLLLKVLRDVMGDIRFINMAEYTALALKHTLEEKGMHGESEPTCRFFVSGYSDKFNKMVQMILGKAYEAEKGEW